MKEKIYKTFVNRNIILYGLIGISGVILDIIFFAVLFNVFNVQKEVANIISTSIGITNNFILNTIFNFKVKDKFARRFVTFYFVGITGIILTNILLFIGTDNLGINANIIKILSLPIVFMTQYFINKKLTFS